MGNEEAFTHHEESGSNKPLMKKLPDGEFSDTEKEELIKRSYYVICDY
jgi:hypothetical protein